jgi:hypothetical protein
MLHPGEVNAHPFCGSLLPGATLIPGGVVWWSERVFQSLLERGRVALGRSFTGSKLRQPRTT